MPYLCRPARTQTDRQEKPAEPQKPGKGDKEEVGGSDQRPAKERLRPLGRQEGSADHGAGKTAPEDRAYARFERGKGFIVHGIQGADDAAARYGGWNLDPLENSKLVHSAQAPEVKRYRPGAAA